MGGPIVQVLVDRIRLKFMAENFRIWFSVFSNKIGLNSVSDRGSKLKPQ